MLIVGLTGGIASGKSLVAKVFKDLGAHVIDADRIVHELLMPNQQAWEEVLAYFGKEIQLPDGAIDRRILGGIVFNDPAKRTWLNNCLHPKVFAMYSAQVKNFTARDPGYMIVLDAALLFETAYNQKMDKTIVVYAHQEQQIERLSARDNFDRDQALARIHSQMSLAEKRGLADYVIDNTGSRQDAEQQAHALFSRLKQDLERESSL